MQGTTSIKKNHIENNYLQVLCAELNLYLLEINATSCT